MSLSNAKYLKTEYNKELILIGAHHTRHNSQTVGSVTVSLGLDFHSFSRAIPFISLFHSIPILLFSSVFKCIRGECLALNYGIILAGKNRMAASIHVCSTLFITFRILKTETRNPVNYEIQIAIQHSHVFFAFIIPKWITLPESV